MASIALEAILLIKPPACRVVSNLGIIEESLCNKLVDSVSLRNGLVHEYDFELNNRLFYDSIKNDFIPAYTEYLKLVTKNIKS